MPKTTRQLSRANNCGGNRLTTTANWPQDQQLRMQELREARAATRRRQTWLIATALIALISMYALPLFEAMVDSWRHRWLSDTGERSLQPTGRYEDFISPRWACLNKKLGAISCVVPARGFQQ